MERIRLAGSFQRFRHALAYKPRRKPHTGPGTRRDTPRRATGINMSESVDPLEAGVHPFRRRGFALTTVHCALVIDRLSLMWFGWEVSD